LKSQHTPQTPFPAAADSSRFDHVGVFPLALQGWKQNGDEQSNDPNHQQLDERKPRVPAIS
jgi:hypothetical protein